MKCGPFAPAGLCCPAHRHYYDPLRLPLGCPPFPGIAGYRRASLPAPRRPRGRGGSPQFPGRPSARSTPNTPGGSSAPAPGSQAPSMAFAVVEPARHPLFPTPMRRPSDDACSGFTRVADRTVARPRFAPGLSTTHGGSATKDPGISPGRTHTGRPSRTSRSLRHDELLLFTTPKQSGRTPQSGHNRLPLVIAFARARPGLAIAADRRAVALMATASALPRVSKGLDAAQQQPPGRDWRGARRRRTYGDANLPILRCVHVQTCRSMRR
jgi:hypothetical protein